MLKINLSKESIKFLKSLPLKQAKQIEKKLMEISIFPVVQDVKQLKGYANLLRVDSGEYRIIYQVEHEQNMLMVLTIGKRNDGDVYKRLKRKF